MQAPNEAWMQLFVSEFFPREKRHFSLLFPKLASSFPWPVERGAVACALSNAEWSGLGRPTGTEPQSSSAALRESQAVPLPLEVFCSPLILMGTSKAIILMWVDISSFNPGLPRRTGTEDEGETHSC